MIMDMFDTCKDADIIKASRSVKNTFIDWQQENRCTQRRNKSLPPSFKVASFQLLFDKADSTVMYSKTEDFDASDSTDVCTEASDIESSPLSDFNAPSSTHGYVGFCEPCAGFVYPSTEIVYPSMWNQAPEDPSCWNQAFGMEPSMVALPQGEMLLDCNMLPALPAAQVEPARPQKLNSKAMAFKPLNEPTPEVVENRKLLAEMLDAARTYLEDSQSIRSVDVAESMQSWSVSVSPHAKNELSVDELVARVQEGS
jgi:hypothetical protein